MSRLPLRDYDYDCPEALVAVEPAEPRDSSRLMVVERLTGRWEHRVFRDLPSYLQTGDCLVINKTKVLACRLPGRKKSGGKADVLLVEEKGPALWSALASGLRHGACISFPCGLEASVEGTTNEGEYLLRFNSNDLHAYMDEHGLAPLPPYIQKRRATAAKDLLRYQTVFAQVKGSIAAPTAALHFTSDLLDRLKRKGVEIAELVLHVGRGTFQPIKNEDADAHEMFPERYWMTETEAAKVLAAKRVISVGTTATRTLETLARRPGGFGPGEGLSSLYIRPGHEFKAVTGLVTNFHLPRSTPLLLAAAFLGREKLLAAYAEAVRQRYRLYSYGDAMLIL